MHEAVGEGRVEDDRQPIDGNDAAVDDSKPRGVCIQLFDARIQRRRNSVPVATMTVAKKCRPGPTLFQPNSMTPRKPASRKNAVSTS